MNTVEPRVAPGRKPTRASALTSEHVGGRLYAVNGHVTGRPGVGWAIELVDGDARLEGVRVVLVQVWVGTARHPERLVTLVLAPDMPVRAATAEDLQVAIRVRMAERKKIKESSRRG